MSTANQRVDIDISQFETAIAQKGLDLKHETAQPCVCTSDDGQPLSNCNICNGTGWAYYDQGIISGIISGIGKNNQLDNTGLSITGEAYLTVLPDIKLGYRDRITHIDGRIVYTQLVINSSTVKETQRMKYPIMSVLNINDKNGNTLPEFVITNTNNVRVKTYNWKVTDNKLEWLITKPLKFSIRYLACPSWLILNMPHLSRGTMTKYKSPDITYQQLPVQCLIKLEAKITDNDWSE
jgi:hypothetical protein